MLNNLEGLNFASDHRFGQRIDIEDVVLKTGRHRSVPGGSHMLKSKVVRGWTNERVYILLSIIINLSSWC